MTERPFWSETIPVTRPIVEVQAQDKVSAIMPPEQVSALCRTERISADRMIDQFLGFIRWNELQIKMNALKGAANGGN